MWLCLVLVCGLGMTPEGLEIRELRSFEKRSDRPFHELTAEQSGVSFINRLEAHNNLPYVFNGAGVAVGDYDGDDWPDLYFLSVDSPNKLYRQVSPLRFEDVTQTLGVDGGRAWSRGATFADVDNDGDLDLYVCRMEAPNLLYINQGDGRFVEQAKDRGVATVASSNMAYFADYDADGDLDMYVLTYRPLMLSASKYLIDRMQVPTETVTPKSELIGPTPADLKFKDGQIAPEFREHFFLAGDESGHMEINMAGQADRLYRNRGDGHFDDVTQSAGVLDFGLGLSAAWLDFNGDGWLDLYVANDLVTRDRLYLNQGDGTFRQAIDEVMAHTTWFSMGSDSGDINNDGLIDFMVADMAGSTHYRAKVNMGDMSKFRWILENDWPRQTMRNTLYLNSGTGRFQDIAPLAGVTATDWTWAVRFGDLDLDGWLDLFVTNGNARDDMNPDYELKFNRLYQEQGPDAASKSILDIPPALYANRTFRNTRELGFENVGEEWGLAHEGVSYAAALADLDRDGDQDLVVNHQRGTARRASIDIEGTSLRVMYTPGHTDDSCSFVLHDRVFTGDTLLIRGTGRTDFQNGNPSDQYHSLFDKLLKLPDETLVYPAHDYKGDTVSTIAEEKACNPRLQVRSESEYVDLMNSLNLPDPKMMDVAVPANLKMGLSQDEVEARGWSLTCEEAMGKIGGADVVLVDLRDQKERDQHGVIPGSVHVPYPNLEDSVKPGGLLHELAVATNKRLIFYCAFGERSAMAVQTAQEVGLLNSCHIRGGMDRWKKIEGPLEKRSRS